MTVGVMTNDATKFILLKKLLVHSGEACGMGWLPPPNPKEKGGKKKKKKKAILPSC